MAADSTDLTDAALADLLEDHIHEIVRILAKRGLTSDDTRRLVELFYWYCHHSNRVFRNMPVQLAKYVAREAKRAVENRHYKPFPARTGRRPVLDWDAVDEKVALLLGIENLDEPGAKINLLELFEMVIRDQGADAAEPVDYDTLQKHMQKFRKENPDL